MVKQEFTVYVRVTADLKSGHEDYRISESRIKMQIGRLLRAGSILEGVPAHGEIDVRITEVIETSKH